MTGSGFSREAAYSVFEALRPLHGQSLDRLAIAAYSVDLVAVAALVLSLSKAGEQELEAGPLSFVDAFEAIAPRVDIVHQKDRLLTTQRHFGILHVLDSRLHPVQPPRGASFHPKLALARYISSDGSTSWKFWLGSRNLTGGQDREAGLLLVGRAGGGRGVQIRDIADMATRLLTAVPWVESSKNELSKIRWRGPEGAKLRQLQWRAAGDYKLFQTHYHGSNRCFAVSPFVDDAGSRVFVPGSENWLLTTETAAANLPENSETKVLVGRAPSVASPMPVDPPSAAPAGEAPEIPDPPGIHAKLLLRKRGNRARLWIGSANLTRRGMEGPNAEILAELDVSDKIADDLTTFIGSHPPASDRIPDAQERARIAAERELDAASQIVLTAGFVLSRGDAGLYLICDTNLDAFLAEHKLEAWLLTRPDTVVRWPEGAQSVLLVPGGVPLKLETSLVCFSAERLEGDCTPKRWSQLVPFPGHDIAARDRAATAAYIGLSGASAWLRASLEGVVPGEQITWTGARRWGEPEHAGGTGSLPLAVEEVLAAWARNPDEFEERALRLGSTLQALGEELQDAIEHGADPEAVTQWQEVERFWDVIRETIEGRHDA